MYVYISLQLINPSHFHFLPFFLFSLSYSYCAFSFLNSLCLFLSYFPLFLFVTLFGIFPEQVGYSWLQRQQFWTSCISNHIPSFSTEACMNIICAGFQPGSRSLTFPDHEKYSSKTAGSRSLSVSRAKSSYLDPDP